MNIFRSLTTRLSHAASFHGRTKDLLAFVAVVTPVAFVGGITSAQVPLVGVFDTSIFVLEKGRNGPVDYGAGPGLPNRSPQPNLGNTPGSLAPSSSPLATPAIPNGGGSASTAGYFAPAVAWPIIPIHMSLLPDGRVLTFGTDQSGTQGAKFVYDVWDPTLGTGSNSHTVLPNTTNQDIFCGAATVLGSGFVDGSNRSGQLLIVGGDQDNSAGTENVGNSLVSLFNYKTNTLGATVQMFYARWYGSVVTLRNGDKLVMGGIDQNHVPVSIPEVYNANTGWRKLTNVSLSTANNNWIYPRAFLGFDAAVYIIQNEGHIMRLDPNANNGLGSLTDTGVQVAAGVFDYPTTVLDTYRVLALRSNATAQVVEFSQNPPIVYNLPSIGDNRHWGNTTLLPNGEVLVTGGSEVGNQLTGVQNQGQIFSWATKSWRTVATAAKPRLYHSAAVLLPDGSVLTGGGGAPGPLTNLNAEIYYPSYLYKQDGSGDAAPRPTIISAPSTLQIKQNFTVTVGANDWIQRVSLVKLGAVTHSFNPDQRLFPFTFSQSGTTLNVVMGTIPAKIPPGYYMLFVVNYANVPSIAKIVSVTQAVN